MIPTDTATWKKTYARSYISERIKIFMKAYQFKIAIKNSHPPIWRRCIVPAGLTFSQLSMILNEIMGWSGYHLFEFEFYHLQLRITEDDGEFEEIGYDFYDFAEASATFINEYMEKQEWFTYIYDLGDDWQHRVTIEKVITDYEYNYPQVLKFKGACPMEDCGGIGGYYECLEILADKNHPEHDERSQWVQSIGYHSEYDIECINENLKENYAVTFGKGEKRLQRELYEAMFNGEKGLTISKTAKNRNKPIRSGRHRVDDSLNKIVKMFETMYRKSEDIPVQLWHNGEDTLEEIFDCYEKKDLMEIAKFHGMKGCSKYNKDNLVSHVADFVLLPEVMRMYFSCLRDNEIKAFEKAIKQGMPYVMEDEVVWDRIMVGGYGGYLGEDRIVIPADVVKTYNKFNSKSMHQGRKLRSFLLDCFNAAGILYGIAPITVIAKMYNQNLPASQESNRLTPGAILSKCASIPVGLMNFVIRDNYFIDAPLLNGNVYKRLEQMQGSRDFYIPSTAEIRDLAEYGYFPNNRYLKKLVEYLNTRLKVDLKMSKYIGAEIQRMICNGCEMQDVFYLLSENNIDLGNSKEMNRLASIMKELWNHTKMILNRGFSPSELTEKDSIKPKPETAKVIDFQTGRKKKIYPNDPCPCGSGKKYKHCCQKK